MCLWLVWLQSGCVGPVTWTWSHWSTYNQTLTCRTRPGPKGPDRDKCKQIDATRLAQSDKRPVNLHWSGCASLVVLGMEVWVRVRLLLHDHCYRWQKPGVQSIMNLTKSCPSSCVCPDCSCNRHNGKVFMLCDDSTTNQVQVATHSPCDV